MSVIIDGLELTQENIPPILNALTVKIDGHHSEAQRLADLRTMVRDSCTHPPECKETGSYQGRWDYVRCTYCGKEW